MSMSQVNKNMARRLQHDPFMPETGRSAPRGRSRRAEMSDIEDVPLNARGGDLLTINAQRTTLGLMIGFLVLLLALVSRVVVLQVVRGSQYRLRSDSNRVRTVTNPAPRGAILDRSGKLLAENVPNLILTITPADLPKNAAEKQAVLETVASVANVPVTDVVTALQSKQRRVTDPITIIEHIPYQQAMKDMIALANVPAAAVVAIPNRHYPAGEATAAILGYTGRISVDELSRQPEKNALDIVGKTGLESTYDDQLTGVDGLKSVERDVRNREQRVILQREPEPGKTLMTTIDLDLQQQLYQRLQAAIKSAKSPGGAAIALNPQNGEILSMVSAPTYDDNWFVESGHNQDITQALSSPAKPLLNRAITGQYPSGSIVKPIIAAAALAEHVITPNTTVLSVGGFKVGNDTFPDWKSGGHGVTNVTKAIAESVNTFFYAVGGGFDNITGLGVDRIVQYLKLFGWGKQLGVDLPSEADGFLPTKEWRTASRPSPWKLGDTYHLSIGQGDLEVTPLQVAAGISAVANGGTLYQPHLLKEVRSSENVLLETHETKVISNQLVSSSVLDTVRSGMREGVLAGSSRSLQSLPVTAGAKTGTAQFGRDGKTHAWFTVFAPFDHPVIAITVIVEAGGEGNATALPVAKDVLQWYFTEGAGKPAA